MIYPKFNQPHTLLAILFLTFNAPAFANTPEACTSSFYCYGSNQTPAGATAVRIRSEDDPNGGTVILPNIGNVSDSRGNNNRPIQPVTNPPFTPTRPVVTNAPSAATRLPNPVNNPNPVTFPAILDANAPIRPLLRAPIQSTVRTQPQPRLNISRVPQRRTTVASLSRNCSPAAFNGLMQRAEQAENQGIMLAKNGQTTGSRQAFQSAAGLRAQANTFDCRTR